MQEAVFGIRIDNRTPELELSVGLTGSWKVEYSGWDGEDNV